MTTYSSPGHAWHVKAESEQEAAWEFAVRTSDRDRGNKKASRPVQDDQGRWMSIVSMRAGPKPVWIEVREVTQAVKRPQALRGFCKK